MEKMSSSSIIKYIYINLSIFLQILTRISYDISLGLLSGIHKDNYACALPWLQALESCVKNNYFILAQFICVQLLPRGIHSFDSISLLRKETNESAGGNREFLLERNPVSNDELLSYFNGFYYLIILYKIWWRAPDILQRFSNSCEVEIENQLPTTASNAFSREYSDGNLPLYVAERIIDEIKCNGDASLSAETPVNGQSTKLSCEDGALIKDPLSSRAVHSSETLSAPIEGNLNICSVLTSVYKSLLSESVFICSTLKKQLLEVKKEVILLRSRRILDSVAAAGSSKQKRSSKKKHKAKQASEGSEGSLVSYNAGEERDAVEKQEQSDSQQGGILCL